MNNDLRERLNTLIKNRIEDKFDIYNQFAIESYKYPFKEKRRVENAPGILYPIPTVGDIESGTTSKSHGDNIAFALNSATNDPITKYVKDGYEVTEVLSRVNINPLLFSEDMDDDEMVAILLTHINPMFTYIRDTCGITPMVPFLGNKYFTLGRDDVFIMIDEDKKLFELRAYHHHYNIGV